MYFQNKKLIGILCLILICFGASAQEKKLNTDLGGLLRFNYNASSWKTAQTARGGDFGLDCFGLKAKATYDKLSLNAEYRFYGADFGGDFIRYGYVGYQFNKASDLKLGLVPVPFGNTGFNSNSFFFSMDYYYGLEADNDMGIAYTKTSKHWQLDLAFLKNAEDLTMGNLADETFSRYAYDVSSIADAEGKMILRNKEVNQLNGRAIYSAGAHQFGASLMWGQLLNLDTEEMGSRYAVAAHYNGSFGRFNLKASINHYAYDAKNPDGQSSDVIAMAAYGAPYFVASESTNFTAGLSYTLPLESDLFDSMTFYNDFGMMNKAHEDFSNSLMNVTGIMLAAGPIYTYIDWAMGKNQAWLGGDWNSAFAQGNANADWCHRLNVNVGFYF